MVSSVDAIPLLNAVRDAMFLSGTVSVIDQPTPTMRRIQLRGPGWKG